jgi:hypothetical protein
MTNTPPTAPAPSNDPRYLHPAFQSFEPFADQSRKPAAEATAESETASDSFMQATDAVDYWVGQYTCQRRLWRNDIGCQY